MEIAENVLSPVGSVLQGYNRDHPQRSGFASQKIPRFLNLGFKRNLAGLDPRVVLLRRNPAARVPEKNGNRFEWQAFWEQIHTERVSETVGVTLYAGRVRRPDHKPIRHRITPAD